VTIIALQAERTGIVLGKERSVDSEGCR
jgi:hypothetical protein